MILDLALTLGLPVVIIVLWIVSQSYRFEIVEEYGCSSQAVGYSHVTFIIIYLPQVTCNLTAAALSTLTLQRFRRHRAEIIEILSRHSDVTPNNYIRMIVITYIMLLFNIPNLVIVIVTVTLAAGLIAKGNAITLPHASWGFIHDGSPSVILKVSAQEWGTNNWLVFTVKWTEWIYVPDAIFFFSIFGTTPHAMRRYRSATSYILEKIGLKKKKEQPSMAVSDIIFGSNSQAPHRQPVRRGTPSILDSSDGSGGHFTVSVRSAGLMEGDREGLKSITGTIEQGGGCKNVSFLSSVQVAIPEETFSDSA